MSRLVFALPLALLLPIAAGAAAATFGSVEEFARATGLKPGGWHTSMKFESAEVEALPGADRALVAQVKARTEARLGRVDETDECVGPASGASLSLPGILVEPACSFSRMEAGDGRWALAATCPDSGGRGTSEVVAQGTYSPETATGRHEAYLRDRRGIVVHVKVETTSRFTGECRRPSIAAPRP